MKMFYFSQGGYNEEYHVMSRSKKDALQYLKRYCLEQDANSSIKNYWSLQYEYFEQHPEHIYEYNEGYVVQTEVS